MIEAMPTNLPPDYFEVEKRFRESSSAVEKAALLEEMLSIVPKHKGTDHLRAELRRKLAKLKEEGQTRKKGGGGHSSLKNWPRRGSGAALCLMGRWCSAITYCRKAMWSS